MPMNTQQLPPWPCCGTRGHHAPDCRYAPEDQLQLPPALVSAALACPEPDARAAEEETLPRLCGATHPQAAQLGIRGGCYRGAGHKGAHQLPNGRSWWPQGYLVRQDGDPA